MIAPCIETRPGSHTPSRTRDIVIDAVMLSIRTSHRAGRNPKSVLSKVYLTIWCSVGSIQSVTRDTLFMLRSIFWSSASSVGDFVFPGLAAASFFSFSLSWSSLNRFVG